MKRLILSLVLLAVYATPSFATVRWMGKAEGEKALGGWVKDVSGPPGRGYWAGEVEEIEIDAAESGFTLTGRVKVKITWVTDRTSYRCHEIYVVNSADCEDFNYRSLMLAECQ